MPKFLLAICLGLSFSANAQFEDVNAVAEDLIFLTEKYISPAAEASAYQSSGGWFTHFTPKKLWDVEVSLQFNALLISDKNKTFLIDEAELQNIKIQGAQTTANSPSALGGDDVVVLEGSINNETFEFDAPEGINENSVKHGQLQTTLGLWKQTNLIVRYAPNIKINKTKYQSYGFGLSHHLNQWIKPLKESSYHFGVLVNYSNYKVEDDFNEADLILGTINSIKVNGETYGFNILASKSVKQFDFSSSVGLITSKFEYGVGGSGDLLLQILNDSLKDLEKSKTSFKADLNVNYRFKDFSFNTMFTFGNYSNINLGINYNIN
tara:strand:- start:2886 stop:3851 length:966 start_codon:yes stop_codon:yes gene_type:complete